MGQADVGDHGNVGRNDVETVQPSTQAHLENGDIHFSVAKQIQSREGRKLKVGQPYLAPRLFNSSKRSTDDLVIRFDAINSDSLVKSLNVR